MIIQNVSRRFRPNWPVFLIACLVVSTLAPVLAARQGARKPGPTRVVHKAAAPAAIDEVRALWVARTTLVSPEAIARMVASARAAGFNTLLVQVRGRGDAYYNGGIEPRAQALGNQPANFDPLATTLKLAHDAGLTVHAWINANLVSSAVELPSATEHVVHQHPEWLMVPRSLAKELRVINPRSPLYLDKLARALRQQPNEVEGLYVSPIDPAAVDYLAAVVGDIVTRYAVDGVHVDYVRYPSDEFDYSQHSLDQFAEAMASELDADEVAVLRGRERANLFAWTEAFPERWREFRRERLTALVERIHEVVKTARPRAMLSSAVVPDAADASERKMQNWREWIENGLLDVVCPMAYATDPTAFNAQVAAARQAAGDRPLWAGIGAYRLSPAQTVESIVTARRIGVEGIILFSYDSLAGSRPASQALTQIGRAVFHD